jgi:hypothetical protein
MRHHLQQMSRLSNRNPRPAITFIELNRLTVSVVMMMIDRAAEAARMKAPTPPLPLLAELAAHCVFN